MARDIFARLNSLESRRKGTDRLSSMTFDSMADVLAKSFQEESWQRREASHPHTRYALGAMQEVGPDYTRISIETAQRVGRQLSKALADVGYPVEFRLQGSVPLNVHIRGVSDVDLLNLSSSFLTYSISGWRSRNGSYTSPTAQTSLGLLTAIRKNSEEALKEKYPTATVDCSGNKAIKISGGSLARQVDVVPSHWHDNENYQMSGQECDRTVTILDKSGPKSINNLPFVHIKLVNERDIATLGGLKKAIRLCKNVRSDAEHDIALPSFDIAAIMYHADVPSLISGYTSELAILAEAQRFLDILWRDQAYARTLKVPDGSRTIFDTQAKFDALASLSVEMDNLSRDVAKEQNPKLSTIHEPSLYESRIALIGAKIDS